MMSTRAVSMGVMSLAIVGFLGLMAFGLLNKTPVTGQSGFKRVKNLAPQFTLPLFDGGEFVLGEHLGHPVVINFWASWCPPCREEAPLLERAWRYYKGENVLFVGVDIQDQEKDARAYIREFGITYPNGPDVDGRITVEYGIVGIPATFFVDKEGIVERRWVGALGEKQLETWVNELIAGISPSGEVDGENPEGFFKLDEDG